MAVKDGQIQLKDMTQDQLTIIKSWNKMKYSKTTQTWNGYFEAGLLNSLAGLVKLPEQIEVQRVHLNDVAAAVDRERMEKDPKPIYKYPVKLPLYKHQIRGANMALMALGLVEPEKGKEVF